MPRLTLDKLRQALKTGTPASAYYIHGAEGILKDEAIGLILDRALDIGTRDFNLDLCSAQQLDPAGLGAACATLPMMAERRVVVVRDIEAWKRKSKAKQPAVEYLERPMPDTVLVMVQGNDDDADEELSSRCVSIACTSPTGDQLDRWLDQRLTAHALAIVPEAREHLIRATGGDLGLLSAEIQKLSGLETSGPIDAETVGALVGVRFGETADDWRDAVLRDDISRALALAPKLLETTGVSGVNLVSLLGTSLLVLSWARDMAGANKELRGGMLANRVKNELLFKIRPRVGSYDPVARLVSEVVGNWPPERLAAATAAVLLADIALKGNTISDPEGIVTDLVLTIAASRTRKAA
jgi:DNA polymerase III subunit delta